MSKGNSGGGAAVGGGGAATSRPAGNAAQQQFPHIAHLLNNAKVETFTRTKSQAKEAVKNARNAGRSASFLRDPKGKGDRNYIVVVPER